jgi:hypothetical protein
LTDQQNNTESKATGVETKKDSKKKKK